MKIKIDSDDDLLLEKHKICTILEYLLSLFLIKIIIILVIKQFQKNGLYNIYI